MADPELGTKRTCPDCAARYYDLNRRPAHCPKCAYEFDPDAVTSRSRVAAASAKAKAKAAAEMARAKWLYLQMEIVKVSI